ncbi:MAG: hypothetical protein FJX23_08240 [Alphaproteobacteria bacterium]|nr:hypothetical protein [Alphaproteobacteria bacterium]
MRFSSIAWFAIVSFAAILLYSVKFQVQAMDAEVASLHRQIDAERASIQVLQAEWAFLSRPERIRALADKHLDMVPVGGAQLMDMADVGTLGDSDLMLAAGETDAQNLKPGVVQASGAGYDR